MSASLIMNRLNWLLLCLQLVDYISGLITIVQRSGRILCVSLLGIVILLVLLVVFVLLIVRKLRPLSPSEFEGRG